MQTWTLVPKGVDCEISDRLEIAQSILYKDVEIAP